MYMFCCNPRHIEIIKVVYYTIEEAVASAVVVVEVSFAIAAVTSVVATAVAVVAPPAAAIAAPAAAAITAVEVLIAE